jgi:hypothetical protein
MIRVQVDVHDVSGLPLDRCGLPAIRNLAISDAPGFSPLSLPATSSSLAKSS